MNKQSETAKPFKLTLHGKPLELSAPTPSQDKLARFFAALPDGELLNKSDVMSRVSMARCILMDAASKNPKIAPYRFLVSQRMGYMFGNAKTIVELAKQVKAMQGDL